MPKVKIVRLHDHDSYAYGSVVAVPQADIDWIEMTDVQIKEYKKDIDYANKNRRVLGVEYFMILIEHASAKSDAEVLDKARNHRMRKEKAAADKKVRAAALLAEKRAKSEQLAAEREAKQVKEEEARKFQLYMKLKQEFAES